jgi:RimJ/RimL family protein N-acetyltransferase
VPVPEPPDPVRRNAFGQPIGEPLPCWTARQWPAPRSLAGDHCRLAPLSPAHAEPLYRAVVDGSDDGIWTYLSFGPFGNAGRDGAAGFEAIVRNLVADPGVSSFAIIDPEDAAPTGMASFHRIEPQMGCLEIAQLLYAPRLQRTTAATEAVTLLAAYAFDDLGYRRLEWKCDALNAPSRRAALRLGFRYEGLFRKATVYKGRSRDTAWFAITDSDWPAVRDAHRRFLDPENFDGEGRQRRSLSEIMASAQPSGSWAWTGSAEGDSRH